MKNKANKTINKILNKLEKLGQLVDKLDLHLEIKDVDLTESIDQMTACFMPLKDQEKLRAEQIKIAHSVTDQSGTDLVLCPECGHFFFRVIDIDVEDFNTGEDDVLTCPSCFTKSRERDCKSYDTFVEEQQIKNKQEK